MKLVNLYESVLLEREANSCVSMFGKQLFGQELGGTEKDTKIEKNYAELINKFTSDEYGEFTNQKFIEAINNLKSCVGQYKEVLLPENVRVYRGITLPLSYFINKKQPVITVNPVPFVYKAINQVESWSVNPDIAALFGNNDEINELGEKYVEGGYNKSVEKAKEFVEFIKTNYSNVRVAVILEYKANKADFLFKSKYFKELSINPHEEEILRISNKPINVSVKFNYHEDVFLTHDGMMVLRLLSKFI